MPQYSKHHFIPKFLLKAWHSGHDQNLTRMSWVNGRFVVARKNAESAGREPGLYAIRTGPNPNVVEEQYLRDLDTRAARVHQKFVAPSSVPITKDDREVWSRFIVSMLLRTPDMIEHVRERGRNVLMAQIEKDPEEYEKLRQGTDPATLRQLFEVLFPHMPHDFGVFTLPQLVESQLMNTALLGSYWRVIGIPQMIPRALIIGDRPLIYRGRMADSYLMALPISPTRVFYSFNHRKTGDILQQIGPIRILRSINTEQIWQSKRHVFARDDSEAKRVHKHFAQMPAAFKAEHRPTSKRWAGSRSAGE